MRSLRKKLFSFVLQIIQSILILFFWIVGLSLLSGFITGARQVNIFNDAWDMFESVYVESYKFHFANISFLFIILSCRFIEKKFVSKLYSNIIIIIVINVGYVFLSFYVFYAFDFNRDLYNKLSSSDLIITALVILFSQIISLYYSVNSNINKKYVQRIYNVNDHIFWYSLILYLYYCQYSYFLIFERMGMMFLMIPVILLFLFFCYNVFLVCRMNHFCKNIKLIPIDSFVYIYCLDYEIDSFFFKFFLKPCIVKMHSDVPANNPKLGGIVMSREHYKLYQEELEKNICIGIDCYSKLSSGQELFLEGFTYSVAIREKQLFNSFENDSILKLEEVYSEVITLKNFSQLKNNAFSNELFMRIQKNSKYLYNIKSAKKELSINKEDITNIIEFNRFLMGFIDKFEHELNRYTVFNNILKGYEAIMHFICTYYLLDFNVNLEDSFGNTKIIDYVEKGGLGSWLEMVYRIVKHKKCYDMSFFSREIGGDIANLFMKINYPGNNMKNNMVNSSESFYHFFSNRLVNLRNNTIGHGSSSYIPSDDELVYMYKIFLYILIRMKNDFKYLQVIDEGIWTIRDGKFIAFLDKLIIESKKLRYLDYLSEKSVIMNLDKEIE